MQTYYLAIDIGASSGRHLLGSMVEGKICLEEIYRFENGMEKVQGQLCWNTQKLYMHILNGMKKCKELGKIPKSMGIDTWGVDFVLLDKNGCMTSQAVGYRDHRTDCMDEVVNQSISKEDLYQRTGIQKQNYNTIYQLMAIKETHSEYLEHAEDMLMTPDYYHYLLTGEKKQEYTIATTSQLVNVHTRDWDYELIDKLGFPRRIFRQIERPGTVVGNLRKEIAELVGYDCQVIMPSSHDTASAVMAIPNTSEETLYISSGTWSLMGIEMKEPNCSLESMKANFTNEGGFDYRYRFLRNIMGLWMIQSVKKEMGEEYSYAEICKMAAEEEISTLVDCNDNCFLSPDSMVEAIKTYCMRSNQQIPQTLGEIAAVIYNSLAKCYASTKSEIEQLTGKHYDCIHIIGGGSNADYLNKLTAKYTGCKVLAGPTEATAIGNILAQMLKSQELFSLAKARECVADSFDIWEYRN
jgi:rhamnulokinase